jgi:acyl-CoA synthetase (AMP-forming)/AMP-acid ligase II
MSNYGYQGGNLFSHIAQYAARDPERPLIAVDGVVLTRGGLVREAERLARALRAFGVGRGTKVGLLLPNTSFWYGAFWAAVSLGAVPVPFDPQAGLWELRNLLALADVSVCFAATRYRANPILDNLRAAAPELPGLKLVVATDEPTLEDGIFLGLPAFLEQGAGVDSLAPVFQPDDIDPLMFACTSGSTGNPKVIVVPHAGFGRSQKDMADYLSFSENDAMLLGMPLYHQGGFGMGLQMVMNGGRVLYQSAFDPEKFLALIAAEKITVLQLSTTLAKILLSVPGYSPARLAGVRLAYFAGEVLPAAIAAEFWQKADVRVVNVIGSTETATMVVWDSDRDREADANEFRALPFTRVRVLNDNGLPACDNETGRIVIGTDALLTEYYKNENETVARLTSDESGRWFDTGDLGTVTATGRIRFAGRVKRIIKRGSNLVYPEELEAFLLTHPAIEAVAVRGEPDELSGEAIVARIQCRKGEPLSRGDIIRFCSGKIAAYKTPDRVEITDELPHDIGKIQFKYLRKEKEGDNRGTEN